MAQTTLFSKSDIDRRVAEMGAEITRDLAGSELIALCVLKGAMFFCSDLMRHIGFDVALDFIQVSSYGDQKTSSGVVTLLKEPQLDMRGKSVLIVEDIIDSGLSMNEVFRYIKLDRGAHDVRTATFLDKPTARKIPFKADYIGFSIDPKFVIGYGLDYAEKYRNIPDIQVLSE
jgi:hypoxanthine phosphoribosyltransferase